jgi:hypothetical protein
VDFHPARISSRAPRPLAGEAATNLSRRLLGLCQGLGVENGVITKEGVLQIPRP